MKNVITAYSVFLLILAVGCASPKKIVYFQNNEDVSINDSILLISVPLVYIFISFYKSRSRSSSSPASFSVTCFWKRSA